jgi:hypothetical protein
LLLLAAALLAALGQYVFSGRLERDLPVGFLAAWLAPVFRDERSALVAIVLLVAAGVAFVLAWRGDAPVTPLQLDAPLRPLTEGVVVERASGLLMLAAVLLFAALNLLLLSGRYETWYVALFAALLVVLALVCLRQDRLRGVSLRFRLVWWEAAFVLALMAGYAALNARDLDNWYYSAIGDEYAFFNLARDLANGAHINVFSAEKGVYTQHMVASSAYQAVFLKLLGATNFNWKLAGLTSMLLTLPMFYLLARELFDRTVAMLGTAMLASAHYLFAFVHIGYFNILPIFPCVAAFCCFIYGVRRSSSLLMLLAGIFAGMGFYTFFSSRSAIVVMALWFLTLPRWRRRWGSSLPVSAGFIATVVPAFATSKAYVIEEMLRQSAVSYDDAIVGADRWDRVLQNIPRTAFAFNYNTAALHYVSGTLADVITAALFVVGVVFLFTRLRDWRYRFLAFWLVLSFVAAGLFSPYPEVSISRLLYLIPVVVLIAAVALTGFLRGLTAVLPSSYRAPVFASVVYLLLMVSLGLNINRFWNQTPSRIPTTKESVAMRALLSPDCLDGRGQRFAIGEAPEPLLKPALESYRLGSKMPVLVKWDNLRAPVSTAREDVRCAVIMGDQQDRERVALILLQVWPDKRVEDVHDHTGKVTVSLIH